MREPCTALILAAGGGRRMGAPKALLELGGVPLVQLHVERALQLGCTRALVIVRPELCTRVQALFAGERQAASVQVVSAVTPNQASSLAVLVRALLRRERVSAGLTLLITPVDALPCSEATYRALRAALGEPTLAATPRLGTRGGHPVLARAVLLEVYASGALDACPPLREVLARAGERRVHVDVTDPAVLTDVDTPAQASALELQLPRAVTL